VEDSSRSSKLVCCVFSGRCFYLTLAIQPLTAKGCKRKFGLCSPVDDGGALVCRSRPASGHPMDARDFRRRPGQPASSLLD